MRPHEPLAFPDPVKPAADALVLEVIVSWGDSVQRVEHLENDAVFALPVDPAVENAIEREVTIARFARGRARFTFPRGATGEVVSGGVARTLDALTREGAATSEPGVAGLLGLPLGPDDCSRVIVGALEARVRVVARGRRATRARRLDAATLWGGIVAVFTVGTMIAAMRVATVTDLRLDTLDLTASSLLEIRHIMALASERMPHERLREDTLARVWSSPIGMAHEGASGTMGRPETFQRDRRYTLARRGPAPELARPPARDQVAQRGVFAAISAVSSLAAGHGPVSPFGGIIDTGHDPNTAAGRMAAQFTGDAFGYDGLGRAGQGFGGGGEGEGSIGLAPLGWIGSGRGSCGCGEGMGSLGHMGTAGMGRILAPRTPAATMPSGVTRGPPRMCGGSLGCEAPVVEGFLSADAIRRVVLRNLGQVRHCHEQGLAVNPTLSGRVAIRFVIGTDGAVMGAGVADSSVSVPAVASCIASAVRRWTFPAPAGGVVTVSYPFTLQAAE
ncbi:MAG: AgmX/PglI C-terminal domain-containing protein [Deltaproteobacteria bacterium]